MLRKHALKQATSFCVYYGIGKETILKNFDLVIIEPAGHTPTEIQKLRQDGILVIAYVSIVEIRSDDPFYSLLDESDWLYVDGQPTRNEAFGNVLVDLRSPKWINLLYHRIGHLLLFEGYDGIFLDTMGNIEWPSLIPVKEAQMQAAVDLVYGIKTAFPDYLLIQNNGLQELCLRTVEWIDAICWENPLFFGQHIEWSNAIINRLSELERDHLIRVMLLYEEGGNTVISTNIANKYVKEKGWMMSLAGQNYTEFPQKN